MNISSRVKQVNMVIPLATQETNFSSQFQAKKIRQTDRPGAQASVSGQGSRTYGVLSLHKYLSWKKWHNIIVCNRKIINFNAIKFQPATQLCIVTHASPSQSSFFDVWSANHDNLHWATSHNLYRNLSTWKKPLVNNWCSCSSDLIIPCHIEGLIMITHTIITTKGFSRAFHPS